MLKQLYIKNFALIDTLDMRFHPGFSVITGETGAGKSIILGAINLLLGQRADSKLIKKGCDKCIIEAHFDLSKYDMKGFFDENDIEYDAEDCIMRRELTAAGKSRAFINDTPAPLATIKRLGEQLIDIHSQHQNLMLNSEDFQLNVLDIISQNSSMVNDYNAAYRKLTEAHRAVAEMKEEIEKGNFREDLYHRLSVILINVPALDERKEDIPLLIKHFAKQICDEYGSAVKTFDDKAIKKLQERAWTGNIRELRNVVERLIILGGQKITVENVESFVN